MSSQGIMGGIQLLYKFPKIEIPMLDLVHLEIFDNE
jgi:hypothetical protein